jgi:alkylation response protein AidB-like acyl-CoA dehydrogenase
MRALAFDDPAAAQFRSFARDWLADAVPDEWRNYTERGLSEDGELAVRAAWDQALAAGRLRCITWPERFGGRALGPVEELIFYEEAAAAGAPEERELIGKHLTGPALLDYGTPDQQSRYLPGISAATELWCEGLSEPGAGSDLAAVTTTATPVTGGYRVSGRKIWTSFAHYADRCFLLARTSLTERKRHNLSVLLLDMAQPGVTVAPIRQITGMHEFNEVTFDDAWVDEADLLGVANEGWQVVTIAGRRASRGLGQAPRRYIHLRQELARLFECSARTGTGADAVAEVADRLELYLWHLRRVAEANAADLEAGGPTSILMLIFAETWQHLTRLGLTIGCPEHESYWRRKYFESRPSSLYGGSSELKRNVIADRVLRLPR